VKIAYGRALGALKRRRPLVRGRAACDRSALGSAWIQETREATHDTLEATPNALIFLATVVCRQVVWCVQKLGHARP
jgi:hypothetical protein